jgi:hypothetical protein
MAPSKISIHLPMLWTLNISRFLRSTKDKVLGDNNPPSIQPLLLIRSGGDPNYSAGPILGRFTL